MNTIKKSKIKQAFEFVTDYENFSAIMGMLILLLFFLGTGYAIYSLVTNKPSAQPSCKDYENYTIDSVPVRCFEYFKINVIETR